MTLIVTTFTFHSIKMRCVEMDGRPWLGAADVCTALGFDRVDSAIHSVSPTDRQLLKSTAPRQTRDSSEALMKVRQPSMTLVSEAGLYRLILRSEKHEAKAFQDWITATVPPAIRKDGSYIKCDELIATGEMTEDQMDLKAPNVMQRKIDRLSHENKVMSDELNNVTLDEFPALKHMY